MVLVSRVGEVSAAASLVMLSPALSLSVDTPVQCLIARRVAEQPRENAADKHILAEMQDRYARTCEFVKSAKAAVYPLFERIASAKQLPDSVFQFKVSLAGEDKLVPVGLFADLKSCESVRESAIAMQLAPTTCVSWTGRP